ncbi:hypothetical protein V3481_017068 [Fusarium oxysporum f. sp. vasinfectum]
MTHLTAPTGIRSSDASAKTIQLSNIQRKDPAKQSKMATHVPKRKLVSTAFPNRHQDRYINDFLINLGDLQAVKDQLRAQDSFRKLEAAAAEIEALINRREYKRLPSNIIFNLAILGTFALAATRQDLPQEVRKVIEQEREALEALLGAGS